MNVIKVEQANVVTTKTKKSGITFRKFAYVAAAALAVAVVIDVVTRK